MVGEYFLQNNPSVEISQWGWVVEEGMASPHWSIVPTTSKACKELKTCKCSRKCDTNACQCREYCLPCTERCKCGGSCEYTKWGCKLY